MLDYYELARHITSLLYARVERRFSAASRREKKIFGLGDHGHDRGDQPLGLRARTPT